MSHADGCARPARMALFGISIAELWRIVRFGANGLFNTALSYALFVALLKLGLSTFPALFFSFFVTLVVNFQTSKRLVFQSKQSGLVIRFFVIYLILFAIDYVFLLGIETCRVPGWLAQAIVAIPIAGLAYLSQRNLIFGGN